MRRPKLPRTIRQGGAVISTGSDRRFCFGYDGPYERIADAIRIDVRRGVPHTRVDEAPIEDVARYVTAQLERKEDAWVVVTASTDEKFGDIVRVVDACRSTRARGIVLNQIPVGAQP